MRPTESSSRHRSPNPKNPGRPAPKPTSPRPGSSAGPSKGPSRRVEVPRPVRAKTGDYKANVGKRVTAAGIDALIGAMPGLIFVLQGHPTWGVPFIGLYLLLRDGIPLPPLDYQSVGKKILGMHVEHEPSGKTRLDPAASLLRNASVGAGLVLFPALAMLSLIAAFALAVAPPVAELVLVLRDRNGLRYGDKLAHTKVYD